MMFPGIWESGYAIRPLSSRDPMPAQHFFQCTQWSSLHFYPQRLKYFSKIFFKDFLLQQDRVHFKFVLWFWGDLRVSWLRRCTLQNVLHWLLPILFKILYGFLFRIIMNNQDCIRFSDWIHPYPLTPLKRVENPLFQLSGLGLGSCDFAMRFVEENDGGVWDYRNKNHPIIIRTF